MKFLVRVGVMIVTGSLSFSRLFADTPPVQTGGYFTTPADFKLFRNQASAPELQKAYSELKAESDKTESRWEKLFPPQAMPRSTEELIAAGRNPKGGQIPSYDSLAAECILDPSERNKRVLRELMLEAIGARQKLNYWRPDGIHEGEAVMRFLEGYDVGTELGIFSLSDHAAIRDEMHQAGHFFEGWLMDSSFSRMFAGGEGTTDYCLNINAFSASALGWIAMLYPDFPESADWLRQSQAGLLDYLMDGFAEDGGYGEGSIHYWGPTVRALSNFMILSKNLGIRDYFNEPGISDRLRATLHWRLDLTAPDGRSFAFGDADRDAQGGIFLFEDGRLIPDPVLVWGGRMFIERGDHFELNRYQTVESTHFDLSLTGQEPTNLSALYPFSGFAAFRSGWDDKADALFFKFGPTYVGRREAERGLVIPGHAHEDSLEFELHYHGVPVVADIGTRGRYQNWATYGGFTKATVAHSTVGLGNPWGYDRLDGLYTKHKAEQGGEFLYEQTQQNIGRADTQIEAFGDLGSVSFSSVKVRTYENVEDQRSIIWFPDDSLTIVADHLESNQEQPYEWYLTPVGNPLGQHGDLIFGDDTAKVQVVPILPTGEHVTAIGKATSNIPPYYAGLAPEDSTGPAQKPGLNRWETFSLLVLQKQAKVTDFLNVLLPYSGDTNPWKSEAVSSSARRLVLNDKEVLLSGSSPDGPLVVKGQLGMVSRRNGQDESYALIEGTELSRTGKVLVTSTLSTTSWSKFYSPAVNGLVSLKDKRASFDLKPVPVASMLLVNPPRLIPGKEPMSPLEVSVSFRVDAKPKRMVVRYSYSGELKLNDPAFDAKTSPWAHDFHAANYVRAPITFTYDPVSQMVTVTLDPGPHQLVWE